MRTAVFDELVESVPAGIREAGLAPNACILATRLGVEALRAVGLKARPLPVRLLVMNETYRQLLDGPDPQDADYWTRERNALARGAWSVGLGYGNPNGHGWDGHLVVIAQERYLIDFTAGQVQRLAKGIVDAKPFWIEARDLVRGWPVALRSDDGCTWLYEARPQDKSFLRAPAWSGYRVSVRGRSVISESTRIADVEVAQEVRVELPRRLFGAKSGVQS